MRPAFAIVLVATLAGCGTTARWHEGVDLAVDPEELDARRTAPGDVLVYFKDELDRGDEGGEARLVCASTTLLRKGFLLEEAPAPAPEREHVVLGWVTTEEFPRDEEASTLHTDEVTNAFGLGDDVHDTFDVRLDPAFREAALARLRAMAARLGADAVIDVFATGEAEHHMWHGTVISFDLQSPHSPIFSSVLLLDLRLRDVRLHGTAIRYE